MVKIKMGDYMKAFGKKILTGITALFITVSSILASTGTFVAADETRPDDPNDGIVRDNDGIITEGDTGRDDGRTG